MSDREKKAAAGWDPRRNMRETWDDMARQNPLSAIIYHATPEEFEERGRADAAKLADMIAQFMPLDKAEVLDIGGGIGRIALYLAPKVRHYHLLDVSGEMLRLAGERLEPLVKAGKVVLHLGDGYSLAGPSEHSIDFALSHMVFQHMDREAVVLYLRGLARVLSPTGRFWFQIPPMAYPERFADAERGDWPANFRRWHPGELLEVCARVGLAVLAADCDGIQALVGPAEAVTWV